MKNEIVIRQYYPDTDYDGVYALYTAHNTFGGQYDDARDTKEKLDKLFHANPDKILVATYENRIVGTVTIFEDGRSAWLYRFAVQKDGEHMISQKLFTKAKEVCKKLGHTQILVYGPVNDTNFEKRYISLAFHKGNDFTAYWQNI